MDTRNESLIVRHRSGARALCVGLVTAAASVHAAAPPTLKIDATKVTAQVSPVHAGLMTEEINHSYDGGLYAEMVHDRAMGGGVLPRPGALGAWSLIGGNAGADLALDVANSLNDAIPGSLRIDAPSASPNQRVGVANEGFWGIAVRPSTKYRLSFYAKAATGFAGPLRVSLERKDGATPLARVEFPLTPGGRWNKYEATLMTGSAVPVSADARLVIATEHPGTFWVTFVSLFPPTWNDRPNGNRIDLMQKLADLHPRFLRFPGGVYLNGATVDTRFDWEKTLGSLSGRPGHPSPWGYWSSDGMGLLEFLEWCEDLRMEPVLGVYAGGSGSGEVPPGPKLQPFVQDALDEIEYVSGDASTKWGAQRAHDGHPAPFKLNYVEIGNEEGGPAYDGRFAQFYDAIKSRYSAIQIIATGRIKAMGTEYLAGDRVKSRTPDVLDEHYYQKATDFFADANLFDNYNRKGPKILVGEWATTEGSPTPNFQSALGDAAWMIGMERNSDVVIMQAYAPLFVNVNEGASQEQTNLIGYDALSSYGSPSYYAQAMFNANRGNEVLESVSTVPGHFFTGATRDSHTGTIYLKAVNASGAPQRVKIDISGGIKIKAEGKLIELTGKPEDTNSIAEPTRIAPVERALTGLSVTFDHTFPESSISVIEIHALPTE